jgi:hypothetical protein
MDYKQKYLKYKEKYLRLKAELQGGLIIKEMIPKDNLMNNYNNRIYLGKDKYYIAFYDNNDENIKQFLNFNKNKDELISNLMKINEVKDLQLKKINLKLFLGSQDFKKFMDITDKNKDELISNLMKINDVKDYTDYTENIKKLVMDEFNKKFEALHDWSVKTYVDSSSNNFNTNNIFDEFIYTGIFKVAYLNNNPPYIIIESKQKVNPEEKATQVKKEDADPNNTAFLY